MKGAYLPIAAALLALPLAAQASTKTYTVQPFESISVGSDIALEATVGPAQSVVAEIAGGNFDDLVLGVQNGRLTISRREHPMWIGGNSGRHYKVKVTVPMLHGLAVSSSGIATVVGSLFGDIALAASSSGRIAVDGLQVSAASIKASSSGRVEAAGTCDALQAMVSGSGRIAASELRCANVEARASNSGRIAAFASKAFSGHASNGGRISVSGKPQSVEVDKGSGGSIDIAD
jgi:hypothetical protein